MYFMWMPYDPAAARRSGVPKVLDPSADPRTLRAAVHRLTTDELVSAWESSDRRLWCEGDLGRRCAVIALRGLILDELEARSPWRYRRWLRRGGPTRPRATGRRSAGP